MTDPRTVHDRWSDLMNDVRAISKDQKMKGGGASYNFRGIDQILNIIAPLLRKHQLIIMPSVERFQTDTLVAGEGKDRKVDHITTITMRYTVLGPNGDAFFGSMAGEGKDRSDKATAKAESMALKYFLVTALAIPTDDVDPEADYPTTDERVAERTVNAADEAAKKLGWGDAKELSQVWDRRLVAMNALPDEAQGKVVAWGKDAKLAPEALTPKMAEEWGEQIALAEPIDTTAVAASFADDEAPF